ncbi:MAG TPA: hypothetical protein VMF69_20790 [Gemmataceae bacterium]|nr:hypothetical protein [Gemmataceae bacterium]
MIYHPGEFAVAGWTLMDCNAICSWLGLPPGTWPPDHYRLLGLEPGEDNAELIEQHVHERLDTVRCYQMTNPEQATEAMNRLAQAFVCLTEPSSKRTYDVQLGIAAPAAPAPINEAPVPSPPPPLNALDWLSSPTPIDWPREKVPTSSAPKEPSPPASGAIVSPVPVVPAPVPSFMLDYAAAAPPPLRQPPPLPPVLPVAIVPPADEAPGRPADLPMAIPILPPLPAGPSLEPVDSIREAAQSGPARRGIGTKQGIYQRIARTRRLMRLWNGLGKYLSAPKRRLSRSWDGPQLVRLLDEIAQLLRNFPPLLGEAGQPGYLVLALTQVDTVKVFQSFSPLQREALSRDWSAGITLLTAHRDFLRHELRVLRKRPWRQRLLRAGWSLIVDQPGTVLLFLALLAVNVALWRSYAQELWQKLFSH